MSIYVHFALTNTTTHESVVRWIFLRVHFEDDGRMLSVLDKREKIHSNETDGVGLEAIKNIKGIVQQRFIDGMEVVRCDEKQLRKQSAEIVAPTSDTI